MVSKSVSHETFTMSPIPAPVEPSPVTSKFGVEAIDAMESPSTPPKKGFNFWMIMLSLMISSFLSALDLTALSTALPRISTELSSNNFSWIASSYALASTSFIPIFAGLSEVFGRKYCLFSAIAIFAVGSAVCGSATSMTAMIAGRTVAGVGGGGILAGVQIVIGDLVSLAERGVYYGLMALVWAIASAIGPVIGGLLADSNWRWLFYINIPIAGIALAIVALFMNLKTPQGSLSQKLRKIDWLGSILFILATTAIILGLTFGGDMFAWKSAATLVPLVGGTVLLLGFFYFENIYPSHPIIPYTLLSNRTTVAGYLTTFLHGLVSMGVIYWLPTYMQVRGHDGVRSGIDFFPTAFIVAPMAIITGISVRITQHYLAQNIVPWVLCIVGAGILSLLRADSSWSAAYGMQVVMAVGLGMLYAAPSFAVLAPLPPSLNAAAMGTHAFARSFGQVIGVVITSTILSNQLRKKLPAEYLASLPGGASSAYARITGINNLSEPLRTAVRVGFSDSIRVIWLVLIGLSALGLICSLFIKSLSLNATTDEAWGIDHRTGASGVAVPEKKTISA